MLLFIIVFVTVIVVDLCKIYGAVVGKVVVTANVRVI